MFERVVNIRSPFPISGNALAIGKAGITFSPKLSSSLKNYKRVDVFWDKETKRLAFCFCNSNLPGSYKLRVSNSKGISERCFISMRKFIGEIGLGENRQILPVKTLDPKETPEGYRGSKVYVVEVSKK